MSEKIWEELNTIAEALGASPLPPSLSKPMMLTGTDFCIISKCLQDLKRRVEDLERKSAMLEPYRKFHFDSILAK